MFGALKEKLKNWLSKNKEKGLEDKPKEEKKERKKDIKKIKKEKVKTVKKEERKNVIQDIAPSFVKEVSKEQERQEEDREKKGFFSFLRKELTKERFDELFNELELILLQNNVAYEVVDSIRAGLEKRLIGKTLKEVNLSKELKDSINDLLINPPNFLEEIKRSLKEKSPFVILFAGINGSGKTTTIAKVAKFLLKNKLSVCLAAADTFRAASIEQIQQHADKLKIPLIKKDYGADPAAVGFDAIAYAKKNYINVVLIDTAGRMQNKDSLMKEMEKIVRVCKPDMKIYLGESINGNDATVQAKAFNEVMGLTGIILSKADVDEKGGTAISVSHVTGKPILFLGMGQKYEDLEVFDKDKLIEKLGL
jgi:fused signal recognition particle receptor